MTARILKGAEVVAAMNESLASRAAALRGRGVVPTLALLRVGERPDDISYEKGAAKRAEKVGVALRNVVVPSTVSQEALLQELQALNTDETVHGVLLFRPLPAHLHEHTVCNALAVAKDVDGITSGSLAGVFIGSGDGYAPCTARACLDILAHYGYELAGKKVVVVGRSLVIGKPVALMLLGQHATVSIAHSRTRGLPRVVQGADIVIACVGRAQMLDASYLSPGQVVIDVGINVNQDGQLVGDVDFVAAEGIVEAITPVPGGVGTVTTSVLMKQVIEAAEKAHPEKAHPE